MQKEKLTPNEILALTDFVLERLEQLDRKPKFWGRKAWEKRVFDFRRDFSQTLEQGTNTFHGAIWQFFECNDRLFFGNGKNGMRELVEYTQYVNGVWVYHNPTTNVYKVVYPSDHKLVPMI